MVSRADVVLLVTPALAASGLLARTVIGATGVATPLLAAPLGPAGFVAAFAYVCWELFVGPTPRAGEGST